MEQTQIDSSAIFENERLGALIKFFRKQKGYTQSYVAKQIGITTQHYSKIERGASSPSLQTFFRLVKLLELDMSDFRSSAPSKVSVTLCEILHHLERFNSKQQRAVLAFLETMTPSSVA